MKKAIKIVLPIVLIIVGLWLLQKLLVPKYVHDVVEGSLIAEYYKDAHTHDVVVLGDCEAYENIDPVYLWENFGINSYIRGSAQQLVWQSYYLLKDTLRYEKPRVVVMSVLALKYDEPQSEAYNRLTLEGMKWGLPKIEAIKASMTAEEDFIEYIFPILRYHERITSLTGDDFKYMFKTPSVSYNGYYLRADVKPAENVPGRVELPNYTFGDNAMGYMEKICKLCKDEGIELILVKAPSLYPYWYDEWEEQVVSLAETYDVCYINYLNLVDEIGIDFRTDTYDGGLHLNVYGADKVSEHLGKILVTDYAVPDRRAEAVLSASWDKKVAACRNDIEEQKKSRGDDSHGSLSSDEKMSQGDGGHDAFNGGYIFRYKGVDIAIDIDPEPIISALPAYASRFEAPSCAFEGMDTVYNYGSFELDTSTINGHDLITGIIFRDDLVETLEGIYIGCTADEVVKKYGDCPTSGNVYEYKKDNMVLRVFINEEKKVSQIQYLIDK